MHEFVDLGVLLILLIGLVCLLAYAAFSPFHLLAYTRAEASSQANADMVAVQDPVFSQRNSHFIFSENYQVLWMYAGAPHLTDLRTNIPTWNAVGRHHVWPFDVSANEGRTNSPPRIQDFRTMPLPLPVNEEIALEQSCNSSGATSITGVGLLAVTPTDTFNRNLQRTPGPRLTVAGSITCSTSALTWSGPQNITFAENMRGGWYSVNGAFVWNNATANPAIAFRLLFPRSPSFPPGSGRILRPGSYVTDTLGNQEFMDLNTGMGEWGRFNNFEPPQLEVLTVAAQSAKTYNLRLDLTYLGTSPSYEAVQPLLMAQ